MSAKIITIEELKFSFDILEKIYDSVRFINPLKKKIIVFNNGKMSETTHNCFDFWSLGKICSGRNKFVASEV